MTKNCGRDAKTVKEHLEDSLRRLHTDHLDLVQFHEINYDNDPDWIIERGCLSEMLKAQKAGKVRFLGFTGHKDPHIHLEMLKSHKWDTVQMPINVCDYHFRSFQHQVVPEANKRGIGADRHEKPGRRQRSQGPLRRRERLHGRRGAAPTCPLSQNIASLVCGIDSMEVLKQDLGIARGFKRLTEEELDKLRDKVKAVAGDGRHERFKSTQVCTTDPITANSTA